MPRKRVYYNNNKDKEVISVIKDKLKCHTKINSLKESAKTVPTQRCEEFDFTREEYTTAIATLLEELMDKIITTGLAYKVHQKMGLFVITTNLQRGRPPYGNEKNDLDYYRKLREEDPLLYGDEFDEDFNKQRPFIVTREADKTYPMFKWYKVYNILPETKEYCFHMARANYRASSSKIGYQPRNTLVDYHRERGWLLYQSNMIANNMYGIGDIVNTSAVHTKYKKNVPVK